MIPNNARRKNIRARTIRCSSHLSRFEACLWKRYEKSQHGPAWLQVRERWPDLDTRCAWKLKLLRLLQIHHPIARIPDLSGALSSAPKLSLWFLDTGETEHDRFASAPGQLRIGFWSSRPHFAAVIRTTWTATPPFPSTSGKT